MSTTPPVPPVTTPAAGAAAGTTPPAPAAADAAAAGTPPAAPVDKGDEVISILCIDNLRSMMIQNDIDGIIKYLKDPVNKQKMYDSIKLSAYAAIIAESPTSNGNGAYQNIYNIHYIPTKLDRIPDILDYIFAAYPDIEKLNNKEMLNDFMTVLFDNMNTKDLATLP